ncbi:MAG: helix-turn-helix transcriptional regulator [Spirochaetaceae bacterium]|nr:helix-turn-helix transcriptional regulator [Spirochaetaceae bacterium]
MNTEQIGKLIRQLRLEKDMTQKDLAKILNITDQAVSKWERGWGLPDISLLPRLSESLGVNLNDMLLGSLDENEKEGGKMKEIHFYICPTCENLIFMTGEANISCCGRTVQETRAKEAKEEEKMTVEEVEFDWYITTNHPMKKDNYISFSAFLINGKLELFSHYPQWNYELRIPRSGKGKLFWYSLKEGLLFQEL